MSYRALPLFLLLALPACAPRPDGEACTPDLPRTDDPLDVPDGSRILSCFPEPDAGCPGVGAVGFSDLVQSADPYCGYSGEVMCGPDQSDAASCCYEVRVDGEWCQ